jgi:hypothetical protein
MEASEPLATGEVGGSEVDQDNQEELTSCMADLCQGTASILSHITMLEIISCSML